MNLKVNFKASNDRLFVMPNFFYFLVLIWPAFTCALAFHFHRKQNSQGAWTGGAISKPKSMWLAYTVSTWFFLPIWMLLAGIIPTPLIALFVFHLISWWIRGPLELMMIYKWFNWSPRYGISHDIFHALILIGLFCYAVAQMDWLDADNRRQTASLFFAIVLIITTLAEALFARMFLSARSQEEEKDNIYFASDDPKWKKINNVTASVVYPAYIHLFLQTIYLT